MNVKCHTLTSTLHGGSWPGHSLTALLLLKANRSLVVLGVVEKIVQFFC